MQFKLIWITFFLAVAQLVVAQEAELNCYINNPKGVPRERLTDFEKVTIDIAINPYEKLVSGKVDFQFQVIRPMVDSIWLDAPGVDIKAVLLDGKAINYQVNEKGVMIKPVESLKWEKDYSLSVSYTTSPKKGMYFVGWNSPDTTAPKQVWTQGQGVDNRYWYPHFDNLSDKLITETKITFENGFEVLSNGELKSKEVTDSATTWHYSMSKPHSSYLVMIAIGKYAVDTIQSASGVEIHNWYYKDNPEKAGPTYYKTAELMDFLTSYTGVAYPWGGYAQVPVHNFLYGAMENTSATIFSDKFQVDSTTFHSQNYVFVNAHEMAHQWFGNLITSRSAEGHWIHEGFATYLHGLWQGQVFGSEADALLFESFKKQALAAGKKDQLPISHADAGSARHYMKAASVIRMLKDEVGEETFRKVLTHFLEKYAHQNVTSEDFLMAFHDVSGYSLQWFFDQWVYKGGEPHLEFTMLSEFEDEKGTFLNIAQTNSDKIGWKAMHLPIHIYTKEGELEKKTIWINQDTTIQLSERKPKQLNSVIPDPQKHLLMSYELINWPTFWLVAQRANSLPVLTRREAVDSLVARKEFTSKLLLEELLLEESDYVALGYVNGLSGVIEFNSELVEKLGQHPFPLTKQALTQHLSQVDEPSLEIITMLLQDQNNDVVNASMIQVANNNWFSYIDFDHLAQRVATQPGLRLTYAQLLLVNGEHDKGLDELIDLTKAMYSVDVRKTAFSLLAQIGYVDQEILTSFYEAGTSFNRDLRNSSKAALTQFDLEELQAVIKSIDNQVVKSWLLKEVMKN